MKNWLTISVTKLCSALPFSNKNQTSGYLNWHSKLKNYRINSELNSKHNYVQCQVHVTEKLKRMVQVSIYRIQSIYVVTWNVKTLRTWTTLVIWRFIPHFLWKYNPMKLFILIVPCIIIFYWNNQQMQLYAVNFIPLLSSLYKFRAVHTPIIKSTTVSTATGTIIGWRSMSRLLVPEGARHPRKQVAVTTNVNLWLYQWL